MDSLQCKKIYWIGGSPCSGKSSIAAKLTKKHNLFYYQVDNYFEKHLSQTNEEEHPACSEFKRMTAEEIWMAPVDLQVQREVEIYRELFDFLLFDIAQIQQPVLIEGAGCLPELVYPFTQLNQPAIWVVPTESFQRREYQKRTWAQDYVKNCSDPQQAFDNWMARDASFAGFVCRQVKELSLPCLLVDGQKTIEENADWAENLLGLTT